MTGKAIAIIAARMTSSRLPGKVLMSIGNRPALELMISRVSRAKLLDGIVVATTAQPSDDPVAALCDRLGVPCFRGDEQDVLGRFHGAAVAFNADPVIRLTGDCPIMDPGLIDEVVALYRQGGFDYTSNVGRRTYPDGLDIEVFSFSALHKAHVTAKSQQAREHVTTYIRGEASDLPEGHFSRGEITFCVDLAHLRWTLDRADDLERIRGIVDRLPDGFSWLDALSLATRHPELLGSTA